MNQMLQWRVALPTLTAILGVMSLLGAASGSAKADVIQTSFEAAGVQSANQTALCAGSGTCTIGTETFDTRTSNSSFSTSFGTGGKISGTYSNVQINAADQYGGAGGVGRYAVAFSTSPYTLSLTTTLSSGINYFGFWLSALDLGNQVSFYNGTTLVDTFAPNDLIAALGSCGGVNPYCTNPNPGFGKNNQLYAYINFFDTNGTFNKVSFTENPAQGGYESDNQTVGFVTADSGTVVDAPEPASLAVLGVAFVGLLVMKRQATKASRASESV